MGPTLGGDSLNFWNLGTGDLPPSSGWQYWYVWNEFDPSLVLEESKIESCARVTVTVGGEATEDVRDKVGEFLPTGEWSAGRPVYKMKKQTAGSSYRRGPLLGESTLI